MTIPAIYIPGGWMLSLLLAPLVVMTVDDLRRREIGVWWMILFIAGCATVSVYGGGWRGAAWNTALNLSLMIYLAAGVLLYLRVRYGRWINPLHGHFGEGDLLFFAGMTPLFGLKGFLLFILASMALGLFWWGWARFSRGRNTDIPLVGVASIVFAAIIVFNIFDT